MASTVSPYPEGALPAEQQAEIVKIRAQLQEWLSAMKDVRAKKAGASDILTSETEKLAAYAFSPAPPYKFRRVLLSCIRCYWLALVATRSDAERDELAARLNCIPPYGDRVPAFDGKKTVEKPGELSAKEYEGLMRTIHLVILGMPGIGEIVKTWRELGEVGVQTWEERD
ncbi:hypothetical protein PLICRDRAFT_179211 [Plicaturopsis crispa FD-325 SS-3]|uniref:Unplaced genomic scaffold PLICRscaffold_16, whole genome shotgun sequence n=1 Tax=Plicaturopsis crispa FD-325 SS-3 TaxID=944288 RepID=A0A0C9T9F4_PLICR|nr:hypothetical protein PLICRDRAFT_179211 [Plicaturopsis crispa FD-325 SS-3]